MATTLPTYTAAEINEMYPALALGGGIVAPARNGMDRFSGRTLHGWSHIEQSMSVIFATSYGERVLRGWVGSFVPPLLGKRLVAQTILRFFWAIATAIDLWEPCYRIKRVFFMGSALAAWSPPMTASAVADEIRLGHAIFRQEGVYYPRGHLGDMTPFEERASAVTGRGGRLWDRAPVQTPS